MLNIVSYSSHFSLTAEDARLLKVDDRIYLFFNDLPPLQVHGGFSMYLGELIEEQGIFVLKEPAKLLNYCHATPLEKNWTPFSSGDKLYVIYADLPRIVLEVDPHTGSCQEVSRTLSHCQWDLGLIRGGTPAYPISDQFISFFHSCFPAKTSKGRAYVMGAYTFDKDPPFTIRAITPMPLGNLADYTQDNSPKVVFPGGLVIQDHALLVAWGKADKQIMITTFDRKRLLSSLVPCP